MISEAIRAAFQWWAKHPWMTFWGLTLLCLFSITIVAWPDLGPLGTLPRNLLVSALLLLLIAWILSFSRGVFVTWQRSKIRAVLIAVAGLLIVVGILAAIAIPGSAAYRTRQYDSDVKSNLKHAADAEEAYYKVNGTYTANIDSLTGFNQSDNVAIAVEATATTYVIIGIVTRRRCKPNTGTWSFNSTTGAIHGTPCSLSRPIPLLHDLSVEEGPVF